MHLDDALRPDKESTSDMCLPQMAEEQQGLLTVDEPTHPHNLARELHDHPDECAQHLRDAIQAPWPCSKRTQLDNDVLHNIALLATSDPSELIKRRQDTLRHWQLRGSALEVPAKGSDSSKAYRLTCCRRSDTSMCHF